MLDCMEGLPAPTPMSIALLLSSIAIYIYFLFNALMYINRMHVPVLAHCYESSF